MRLNGHCSDFINMPWILHKRSNNSEYVKLLWISFVQKTGAINKYLIDKKKDPKTTKEKMQENPRLTKNAKDIITLLNMYETPNQTA